MHYSDESTREPQGRAKKKNTISAPLYILDRSGCLAEINNNLTPHKTQCSVCQHRANINGKAAAELTGISQDSLLNVVHSKFLYTVCQGEGCRYSFFSFFVVWRRSTQSINLLIRFLSNVIKQWKSKRSILPSPNWCNIAVFLVLSDQCFKIPKILHLQQQTRDNYHICEAGTVFVFVFLQFALIEKNLIDCINY